METRIKWCPTAVRKMTFDEFYDLCKGQYKQHYAKMSKEKVKKEYEYLTGFEPIKNENNE